MQLIRFVSGCALALALSPASLEAEEFSWKAPISGNFNAPDNWQPAGVPGTDDTVNFNLGSSGYTVEEGRPEVARLRVGNDKVRFEGLHFSALDDTTPAIQIGTEAGGLAEVELFFSSLRSQRVEIGTVAGAEAKITAGPGGVFAGTPLDPAAELVVGAAGKATVDLQLVGSLESSGALILGRDLGAQGLVSIRSGAISADGKLTVGHEGQGELVLSNVSRANIGGEFVVGRDSTAVGSVHLSDSSELRPRSPAMSTTIGAAGQGSLTIDTGALAHLVGPLTIADDVGSLGSVTVSGERSRLEHYKYAPNSGPTTVGNSGTGFLEINSGGRALISGPMVIGRNAGSSGTVSVDGERSELVPYSAGSAGYLSLTVGEFGKGELNITGGAQAKFENEIVIGDKTTGVGNVTVSGSGSLLDAQRRSSGVVIGKNGQGTLTVNSGGSADFGDGGVSIGLGTGSVGKLEVDGADSIVVSQRLENGAGGSGEVSINSGGRVQLWDASTGQGIVNNFAGGTIEIHDGILAAEFDHDRLKVNNLGQINNQGLIRGNIWNLPQGALVNGGTIDGDVTNAAGSTLHNTGTIDGDVNLAGGTISGSGLIRGLLTQSGGTISPGNSPGTLEVGSLDLEGGTLVIEMNSAYGTAGGPVGWDLIDSLGIVSIAGPLTVELTSLALDNQPGDVFDFDPNRSRSWTIVRGAPGPWSTIDLNLITLDTTGFSNDFAGEFSLEVLGANLALTYLRPVPEPGSLLLAGFGVVAVFVASRRRRRSSR